MINFIRKTKYPLIMVIVVLVTALIPLIKYDNFYLYADTVNGYVGQMYHTGYLILHGQLPVFSTNYYASGNFIAEGQWGTFSPLSWLIGVFIYLSPNVTFSMTLVKIAALVALSIGVYLLSRSFEIDRQWSSIAGFLAPNVGFIHFTDAPSWITDLLSLVLFIFTFWAYRKYVHDGWSIIVPFIFGFFLVTQGYVYGVIYLVILLVSHFLVVLFTRNWQQLRRVLLFDILMLMLTLAVYMPGILTGSVTTRAQTFANTDFGSPTFSDFINSFFPLAQTGMTVFTSGTNYVNYIAWVFVLLPFINFSKVKQALLKLRLKEATLFIPIVVLVIFNFGMLLAPDQMGPIRMPYRNFAYLGVFEIIFFALMAHASQGFVYSKRRLGTFFAIIVAGYFLNFSQVPWLSKRFVLAAGILGVLGVLIFLFKANLLQKLFWPIVGMTLIVTGLQTIRYYDIVPNLTAEHTVEYNWPGIYSKKQADSYTPAVKGSVAAFGAPKTGTYVDKNNYLFANTWYFSKHQTINAYTPVSFGAFWSFLNFTHVEGTTAIEGVNNLFSTNSVFEKNYADLLAIDNVIIYQANALPENYTNTDYANYKADNKTYRSFLTNPPAGWHISKQNKDNYVLSRDTPFNEVGSVTGISNGANVQVISNTDRKLTFKVTSDEQKDVQVVFSRLAWPGYSIDNAKLNRPVKDMLVNATVKPDQFGKTITLSFDPPFYAAGKVLVGLTILIVFIVVVVDVIKYKRRT